MTTNGERREKANRRLTREWIAEVHASLDALEKEAAEAKRYVSEARDKSADADAKIDHAFEQIKQARALLEEFLVDDDD